MIKTYDIFGYLTDEEIERGLATEYIPRNLYDVVMPRNCEGRCFLGEAVPLFDNWDKNTQVPSPTPSFFATQLERLGRGDKFDIVLDAQDFTEDFDRGLIKDLAATAAASRT